MSTFRRSIGQECPGRAALRMSQDVVPTAESGQQAHGACCQEMLSIPVFSPMRRLVESWLTAERSRGLSQADAIRQLNDILGAKHTHSRIAEWRRGRYAPSQDALSYMLFRTLPWAIDEVGIAVSDDQFRALVQKLWCSAAGMDDGGIELG